jgi:hypothetical protein
MKRRLLGCASAATGVGFLEHHISYFIHTHHEPLKFICDRSTIKSNLLQEKRVFLVYLGFQTRD